MQANSLNPREKNPKLRFIGLLTSNDGTPITTEVFKGNTQDPASLQSQIQKCKERFHCQHVTFVGDRGMIVNVHPPPRQAIKVSHKEIFPVI